MRNAHPRHLKENHLDERQEAFIEWLVDPSRDKGSQNAFARELGVDPGTLTKWKKDIFFREAWERRLAELNVAPDRVQAVVDSLYRNAVSGDVKAASLWLQYIDRFTPKKAMIVEDKAAKDLSDEELVAMVEDNIIALKRNSG